MSVIAEKKLPYRYIASRVYIQRLFLRILTRQLRVCFLTNSLLTKRLSIIIAGMAGLCQRRHVIADAWRRVTPTIRFLRVFGNDRKYGPRVESTSPLCHQHYMTT